MSEDKGIKLTPEERRVARFTLDRLRDLADKAWEEEMKARDQSITEEERFVGWVLALKQNDKMKRDSLQEMLACLIVTSNPIEKDSFSA